MLSSEKLFSFDVTSLFTNVLVEEGLAVVKEVTRDKAGQLPLTPSNFKLVELWDKFNVFNFQGHEFRQVYGMAIESPLPAVLACLFMEKLEAGSIKKILGSHITWMRYVNDLLPIVPRRFKHNKTL